MTKNNEQIIIDDLKEMIYKLQIECAEKTDNILALGEKLHSKEQECEELTTKCSQLKEENKILKNFLKEENCHFDKIKDLIND